MARLVISNEICSKDILFPNQIFIGGNVSSHAVPTGYLGQIGSYAPDQGIRFGTLEFVADSRGELVLIGPSTLMEEPADPDASTPRTSGPTSEVTFTLGLSGTPNPVVVPGSAMAKQDLDPLSCHFRTATPHIDPTRFSDTHPAVASFLNELFDRIQTMHMTDDQTPVYDWLGLKPDDREILIPTVTHLVVTVECTARGSSP